MPQGWYCNSHLPGLFVIHRHSSQRTISSSVMVIRHSIPAENHSPIRRCSVPRRTIPLSVMLIRQTENIYSWASLAMYRSRWIIDDWTTSNPEDDHLPVRWLSCDIGREYPTVISSGMIGGNGQMTDNITVGWSGSWVMLLKRPSGDIITVGYPTVHHYESVMIRCYYYWQNTEFSLSGGNGQVIISR